MSFRTIKNFSLIFFTLLSPVEANQKNCPSKSQDGFVAFLESHREKQSRFITFPLPYTFVEQIGLEIIDKTLFARKLAEIPYFISTKGYVILDIYSQKKYKLQKEIQNTDSGFALKIYKPGTDYVIIYQFKKSEGCWSLASIDNRSL